MICLFFISLLINLNNSYAQDTVYVDGFYVEVLYRHKEINERDGGEELTSCQLILSSDSSLIRFLSEISEFNFSGPNDYTFRLIDSIKNPITFRKHGLTNLNFKSLYRSNDIAPHHIYQYKDPHYAFYIKKVQVALINSRALIKNYTDLVIIENQLPWPKDIYVLQEIMDNRYLSDDKIKELGVNKIATIQALMLWQPGVNQQYFISNKGWPWLNKKFNRGSWGINYFW